MRPEKKSILTKAVELYYYSTGYVVISAYCAALGFKRPTYSEWVRPVEFDE